MQALLAATVVSAVLSGTTTTTTIERAEFVAAPGDVAPAAPPGSWTAVTLPDRWRERRPATSGPGWYRFTLQSARPADELWSIYLPDVNMNAAVFLNGALVGVEGAMDGALGNNWNRSLFFSFPGHLIRAGGNEVMIKLQAHAFAFGGLGPVLVGPARILAPRFERHRLVAVTLSQVAAHVAAWLGLWALGMWLGMRREPLFGWFALAMACFTIASLNFWVRDLPVPRRLWEWAVNLAPNGFGVASLLFIHRLLSLKRPRRERFLLTALLACGLLVAVAPQRWFYELTIVGHAVGVAAAALCVWNVFRHGRRASVFEARPLQIICVTASVFGLHDMLIQLGVLAQGSVRLLPHAISLCVVTLGTVVVARLLRHNADLRRAVAQREEELAAQFARLRQFEREQLVSVERERLMRELHDGLGGHLAATLALAERSSFGRSDVVESVRLISEELSLLVDALDPTLDDIPSLLAVLRGRIEPRLVRSGLRFDWRVSEVPFERKLPADHLHHVMRIVQEAIANVIKHAGATTILVRTSAERDRFLLEIRDDGRGLTHSACQGRGVGNMKQRARQLGGELTVTAASPGTAVFLRLPLGGAALTRPDG